MSTSQLDWLRSCADRLTNSSDRPIQLRALLKQLGITLRKQVSVDAKCEALVQKTSLGKYEIVLLRRSESTRGLTPRERFTIAHELGHVLIDLKFGWLPTTRDEYYAREMWCNEFA